MIYPICSVVAVFKMLVRILNTLRRRIWDISFFLFSDYLNPQLARMEFSRKLWLSMELNSKGLTFNRKCIPSGDFHSKFKSSSRKFLRQSPLFLTKILIPSGAKEQKSRTFIIQCGVGANKNAGQAFSMPRLSSHWILYKSSAFRLSCPTNLYLLFLPLLLLLL